MGQTAAEQYRLADALKRPAAKKSRAKTVADLLVATVPLVSPESKISDVEELLLKSTKVFETIDYVYVLTGAKKIAGVLSVKEIFRQPKTASISAVMTKKLAVVSQHSRPERAAYLALKHNIKSIPVIDADDKFLGVVPSDSILRILYQEASDNLMRLAGIHRGSHIFDNVQTLSIGRSVRHRLPWLLLGMIGGLLTANIIKKFEMTLASNLMLASFIPLVVYMASAVGTQTSAFIIRDLAFHSELSFFRYFIRQLWITFLLAAVSSGLFWLLALVVGYAAVAAVLSISLFAAIASSIISGLVVPYLSVKIHQDPANASGPLGTILQDILSIVIYFSIATWLL